MRVRCPILVLLAALSARGDVIYLKNGRTIWADSVREIRNREDPHKDRVEYDVGEDTYTIPKSSVDHIDSGETPPARPGAGAGSEIPSFTPPLAGLNSAADLNEKIIHDGKVDTEALAALAKSDDPAFAASLYFLAGKHESDQGNFSRAKRYFDSALRFQPDNATLLIYYAASLMRTGEAAQALPYAQRAARLSPESPDALAMLGFAQFATDHTGDAIRSWRHSLALRPDAKLNQYLERAERESQAESNFSQRETGHFSLHFEGKETTEDLRRNLLATLDSDYDDLVRDLGYSPHDSIVVTLYTQQAFFDVTRAPSWSGAINDGKLRIPVSGVQNVTPDLARVLKHELTHSFIAQMSGGRCPTWLNEGIAQLEEGRSSGSNGHALAQLFGAGAEIPFNMLEGPFLNFSEPEANTAYAESLAATEYIRDTYGMEDIQRILERLAQGSATEAALRATIRSDYRELQDELTQWLAEKYGR